MICVKTAVRQIEKRSAVWLIKNLTGKNRDKNPCQHEKRRIEKRQAAKNGAGKNSCMEKRQKWRKNSCSNSIKNRPTRTGEK